MMTVSDPKRDRKKKLPPPKAPDAALPEAIKPSTSSVCFYVRAEDDVVELVDYVSVVNEPPPQPSAVRVPLQSSASLVSVVSGSLLLFTVLCLVIGWFLDRVVFAPDFAIVFLVLFAMLWAMTMVAPSRVGQNRIQ